MLKPTLNDKLYSNFNYNCALNFNICFAVPIFDINEFYFLILKD